jgi:hypothetical protein
MVDRVAQGNQAAKADAAQKDRAVTKLAHQQAKCSDLVGLIDEKTGLVGSALTKKIECCDAKASPDESVAIDCPQLRVLRQPIDQHVGWRTFRPFQLIAYAV